MDGKVLDVLTGGGRGEMEAQPVVSYNLVLSGDFGTTASWGGGFVGGGGHQLELARCQPLLPPEGKCFGRTVVPSLRIASSVPFCPDPV